MLIYSLLALAVLSAVHLFANQLRFLEGVPRSRWLSIAGGVSVAYVFLHMLPELHQGQQEMEAANEGFLQFFDHHVFLVALLGLVTFYGLERYAKTAGNKKQAGEEFDPKVFWVHMLSFSVYNGLIGYLLSQKLDHSPKRLLLFTVAMALHFLITDYGLRQHFRHLYLHWGRFLLTLAIGTGWLIGFFSSIPELVFITLLAFLSGGVILNVMKEELPEERKSRFSAFLMGVVVYSALMFSL